MTKPAAAAASVARLERRKGRVKSRYGGLDCLPTFGHFVFKVERDVEMVEGSGIIVPSDIGTARAPSRTPNQTIRYTVLDPGEGYYAPNGEVIKTPLRKGDEVIFQYDGRTELQPKVAHPMMRADVGYGDIRGVAIIQRKSED